MRLYHNCIANNSVSYWGFLPGSSRREQINDYSFVLGALLCVLDTNNDKEIQEDVQVISQKLGIGRTRTIYGFKRCVINNVVYHSKSYQKATVRNNFTAAVNCENVVNLASILSFYKVCGPCTNINCTKGQCNCNCGVSYFAICKMLVPQTSPMPSIEGRDVISHIIKVKECNRYGNWFR